MELRLSAGFFCAAMLLATACGVVTPPTPPPAKSAEPAPAIATPPVASAAPAPATPAAQATSPETAPTAPVAKTPPAKRAPDPPKAAAAKAAPKPPEPKAPAAAPLDLKSLEQRLKETNAIGVLTKLSLKNQVDDLLARFRAFHAGSRPPTLNELRPAFELLLMKVLSLLQDKDTALASDINASRDAIWGVLADRQKFGQHL